MTTTKNLLVALPQTSELRELVDDIATAAARADKADPGDRADIVRYERLCSALEGIAWHAARTGALTLTLATPPSGPGLPVATAALTDPAGPLPDRLPAQAAAAARAWLGQDRVVVALAVPFAPGRTSTPVAVTPASDVAETWRAPGGEEGARAVEARFRAQIEAALAGSPGTTREAVDPSGVHNRVLTQVLRRYVQGRPETRVDAPVAYRDGSAASHPFPLLCLPLGREAPRSVAIELRLSLLSIRHTEMDPVTDGAWLRNAEVSRPRPAAQTDDFVYATSLAQLDALTRAGQRTARLHVYQTGLDTAIVGFYRAVTVHLLGHPGSLTVIPMFAAPRAGQDGDSTLFRPGQPWCTEGAR